MTAWLLTLFLIVSAFSAPTFARTTVRVGAYEFSPYFEIQKNKSEGITVETVKILNSMQREFNFEIQRMPADQRYTAFSKKRVDMFLFEDPAWEWSKIRPEFVPLDVEDGEVYVTKKGTASPQRFEELKKMRIAIVKGYHYGFAGLDADERYLKKNFKVELAEDSAGSLHLVLNGKADVTVVAKSYIYDYLKSNPQYRDQITISNNYDSIYKLGVIFNADRSISRQKLEGFIEDLKKDPAFIKIIDERFTFKEPGK